jgi:hypothetical protein
MHRFENVGHSVFRALAGNSQTVEGLPNAPIVAGFAEFVQARHLSLVALRVHFENGDGERAIFGVGIHTNYFTHVQINLALIAICRVRDLLWKKPLSMAGSTPPEFLECGGNNRTLAPRFDWSGLDEEGAAQRIDRVGNARSRLR